MCSHTDRIALIPAYQPDEKLPALAREAESKGFSVIFILVIALHRYFFYSASIPCSPVRIRIDDNAIRFPCILDGGSSSIHTLSVYPPASTTEAGTEIYLWISAEPH